MISVIVPAYNAEQTLGACLAALAEQTINAPYEVIVVDDGSTDRTAAIAREHGVKLISTPRGRPAAARNAGFRAAQGQIVCCTDADCQPVPTWLEELTLPLRNEAIAAAKGTYLTRQQRIVPRFVQLEYEDKYDRLRDQSTIDFIDTYSAAYRRDIVLDAGGFDPRFDYLEDQELSFRLAASGQRMVFQPEAIVYHHHAQSLLAYVRKKFVIGYWKVQVVRRFPAHVVRDSHTPQVMKVQMALVALLLLALVVTAAAAIMSQSLVQQAAVWLALATALLFALTTLPFAVKAWSSDRSVALVSPILLAARALSLGFGTAWGVIRPPAGLKEASPPSPGDNSSLRHV